MLPHNFNFVKNFSSPFSFIFRRLRFKTALFRHFKRTLIELNQSHTEYANYVENCKKIIAEAITNKGVDTNSTDSADIMAENINKLSSGMNVAYHFKIHNTSQVDNHCYMTKITPTSKYVYDANAGSSSYSDDVLSLSYSYPTYKVTLKVDCYVNNGTLYTSGSTIEILRYDNGTGVCTICPI